MRAAITRSITIILDYYGSPPSPIYEEGFGLDHYKG